MFLRIIKILVIPAVITSAVAIILYYLISNYVIGQTKDHIKNVILSHRGLHLYIQRDMHPAFFKGINSGFIKNDYYNPVILSSSFVVRTLHKYYNEERKKLGMSDVYYKMAADNPRNPVNRCDEYESRILKLFNTRRDLKEYEDIVTIGNKKYIYYSLPFLETTAACLKCHGNREDAPQGLQKVYPGEGGFGDKIGNIRAIESIRVAVDDEISTAVIFTGSATSGLIALIVLLIFSTQLRQRVREKTLHLEEEVAENVRAKKEISISLKEKEVLLKEVHHRVKNNMAIISSFLELQSMSSDNDNLKLMLTESISRIKSMAILHEKLYLSRNFTSISVNDYLRELVSDLAASFGFTDKERLLKFDVDDADLNLDLLIPLGLLVNEIVMNSLKHAFVNIKNPEIYVSLKVHGGLVNIIISDNGSGMPDKEILREKNTLGLDIIEALTAKLKADTRVTSIDGTRYDISFKNESKDSLNEN